MTYHLETKKDNVQQAKSNQTAAQPKAAAGFVDNRASTAADMQLKAMMDSSSRHDDSLMQLMAAHAAAQAMPVQRVEEEEMLQGKFATAQRVEEEELLQGKFEPVQRAEEEELLQGKFEPVQRVEEEELLQGKFESVQLKQSDTAQLVEQAAPKANNTGLPNQLKAGIESLSGMSMDHVQVHYNSSQPAQLNAHAYAQGSEIHVAPGQEQHLPHEAWHVVQQAQGRVKPTMQMKAGVAVNDDVGLETEADVMGAKALGAAQLATKTNIETVNGISTTPIVQKITEEDMVQAVLNIRGSATQHGYSREGVESIVRNRFSEITPGLQRSIVLGLGADESNPYYGRLMFDCTLQSNGTYFIDVFHAHGGQTESNSRKGY